MSKITPRTFECEHDGMTFTLRVLSGEDGERVNELRDSLIKEGSKELRDELYALCIVSYPWEGTLRSVLNDTECWRLIAACIAGSKLTGAERKKLGSQSTSLVDNSASTEPTAT
jgi:hypothetical protein